MTAGSVISPKAAVQETQGGLQEFSVTQAVRATSMDQQGAAKAILLPLYTAKKERFTPMTAHLSGKKSLKRSFLERGR